MSKVTAHDNKVSISDNTDTEIFSIPAASAKTVYTVVAAATTTVAAVSTAASVLVGGATTGWGFTSVTQADNLVKAVNQLVIDLKAFKVVT